MVVIRLARGGSKKRPFYNVVVTDSRMRRDSHSIERLGYYNPVAAGADVRLHFEEDRVNYWLSKGAQMSDTVARLFKNRVALAAPESAEAKAATAAKNSSRRIVRMVRHAPLRGVSRQRRRKQAGRPRRGRGALWSRVDDAQAIAARTRRRISSAIRVALPAQCGEPDTSR